MVHGLETAALEEEQYKKCEKLITFLKRRASMPVCFILSGGMLSLPPPQNYKGVRKDWLRNG